MIRGGGGKLRMEPYPARPLSHRSLQGPLTAPPPAGEPRDALSHLFLLKSRMPSSQGTLQALRSGSVCMRDDRKRSTGQARAMRRKMTHAEIKLWLRLRSRQVLGFHFRRQHPIGPHIVDFACTRCKLAIEIDGPSHTHPANRHRDLERTKALEHSGWRVIRFWNTDVFENITGVIDRIALELHDHSLTTTTVPSAGETLPQTRSPRIKSLTNPTPPSSEAS